MQEKSFTNPILPGFYPDPSICRVDKDFYLVNSTFSYFPGVPVFWSRDLVNWKQIGNVLTRESQLNLDGAHHSEGIFAPTIRYHNGKFYVITTNVSNINNFIVTAENPEGPWSDPYILEDTEGIDPSLFFDDDGKAYYVGTRSSKNGMFFGDNEIWLREFDVDNMCLKGETYVLWKGAMVDAIWPEGPHIYKKDGYYYLLIAEGGTGSHHSITIARSKKVMGYYEGNKNNPILTHRHLGKDCPITNVGHGDLVETPKHEWFMVFLASRPYGGHDNLGRETFMIPIEWEDGWPVVNKGRGIVEFQHKFPDLETVKHVPLPACENFDSEILAPRWLSLRKRDDKNYSLTKRKGHLRLFCARDKIEERSSLNYICIRQQHMNFSVKVAVEFFTDNDYDMTGIIIMQNDNYYMSIEIKRESGNKIIRLVKCFNSKREVLAQSDYKTDKLYISIFSNYQSLNFYFAEEPQEDKMLANDVDGRFLSTNVAGGFVGNCIGMFATSNGVDSHNYADYDYFEYCQNNHN